MTKSVKPRVVYDGAATVNGVCLNQLVLAGENLLNGLVEVLTRFRMGKYACVTDLSRCFFQIKIPTDQRDLFRLVWFKDNDLDNTDTQIYRFTRHVWGHVSKELKKFKILDKRFCFLRYSFRSRQRNC